MPLTDRQVKAAKPQDKKYKLADEKGLYLEVRPNGSKYWRLKYRFQGKEKLAAFGTYPDTGLAAAREQRDAARRLLAQGVDPNAEKRAKKEQSKIAAGNSFEVVAREWYAARMLDKSESHRTRTLRALEVYLFPKIGRRPVTEVTPQELLEHLRKIEQTGKIETARRCKQTASAVFRFAIASGLCERDPAGDLRGALQTPIKRHFAAITEPSEFGKLLVAMDAYTGTPSVKAALKCSALWFCRPGELRQLEWGQVNLELERIEFVSGKKSRPHIIPLSRQSIEILRDLEPITRRSKFIFPSNQDSTRPMSQNTIRVALRTMGYGVDQITAHGFRASARTMLDEVLGYPPYIIEQQLCHEVRDATGRSYNRTAHLEQRRKMMQHWADYLDQLRTSASTSNIVTAKFGSRSA